MILTVRKPVLIFLSLVVLLVAGCARVPKQTLPVTSLPTGPGVYHTVERGQTLYRIAKMYGVEVSDLMRVNQIYNPSQLDTGRRLLVPTTVVPIVKPVIVSGPEPITLERARQLIGPKSYLYSWQTITVHHSGTHQGSAKSFDRDHTRRHMGGLFYHFVIGNGTRTPDGSAEVGFRWKRQIKANRPNDIQICLVGDFSKEYVSEAQLNTLVNLIKAIQEEYHIPTSHIRRHNDVKGKNTECPGKHFPFSQLIERLNQS